MTDQPLNPSAMIVIALEVHLQANELPSWPLYGLDTAEEAVSSAAAGKAEGLAQHPSGYQPPWAPPGPIAQTARADGVDLRDATAALRHNMASLSRWGNATAPSQTANTLREWMNSDL